MMGVLLNINEAIREMFFDIQNKFTIVLRRDASVRSVKGLYTPRQYPIFLFLHQIKISDDNFILIVIII